MINDMRTMIWKEWSELQALLFARDNLRGGILTLLLFIAAFSIFEPWRIGLGWIGSPIMLFSFILLMPLATVGTMIPDSFAGERERLTLEPLLATPLSDRAILFGKISAAVGYGWGVTLLSLGIGLLATNLVHASTGWLLYPADVAIRALGFSLLVSICVASAGALVSLRAPTVRQAQQSLGLIVLIPLIVPAFFIGPVSPLEWKLGLAQTLATIGLMKMALALAAILVILDVALVVVTLARFHRTQLLLN